MVHPKGVFFPISKLHSILAVANLLAHNNKSQICYCGQISLQSAAVNCSFLTPLGVTLILLAMVHWLQDGDGMPVPLYSVDQKWMSNFSVERFSCAH